MTAAQKKVAANFKKALAYRKQTGCSLKEAFAKVYGKKTTATKKAAPKKSATKKRIGAYVSPLSIERMDSLVKGSDLLKFSTGINGIIDDLMEDGFSLTEIKEYIKLRLTIIYKNIK